MRARKEGFWRRWSRLKRDGIAAPSEQATRGAAEASVGAPKAPIAAPDLTAREADGAGFDLPDIGSLDSHSDYTAFLRKGVPRHLRMLALRKLWSSDPKLANLDGLVDYGEDFASAFAPSLTELAEAAKTLGENVLEGGDAARGGAEAPNAGAGPEARTETGQATGDGAISKARPKADGGVNAVARHLTSAPHGRSARRAGKTR